MRYPDRVPSVLVIADLHLDVGRWDSGPYDTRQVWGTSRAALDFAVQAAIERKDQLDAVVFAGDVFHTGRPWPEAIKVLYDALARLSAAGIVAVMVTGNHEMAGWPAQHRHIYQLFEQPGKVAVVLQPEMVRLPSGAVLSCLPWVSRHFVLQLVQQRGEPLGPGGLPAATSQYLAQQVADMAEQPDATRSLLVGHAMLAGATLAGSELTVAPFAARFGPVLTPDELSGPWDLRIMGHVHRHQRVADGLYYAGTPWTIDFEDAGVPHGPLLVTWGGPPEQSYTLEQLAGPDRQLVQLQIEPGGAMPADANLRGAIVRLTMPDSTSAQQEAARQAVAGLGARLVDLRAPMAEQRRTALRPIAVDAGPEAALREWAIMQHLSAAEQTELLQLAERLAGTS